MKIMLSVDDHNKEQQEDFHNVDLLVDDHLLQLPLGGGSLHDLLVDGVGGDESVDHDGPRLADTVTPVLGLTRNIAKLRFRIIPNNNKTSCKDNFQYNVPGDLAEDSSHCRR